MAGKPPSRNGRAKPSPSLRAVDLFSGPGGLTIGMKRAGIQPLCSVEMNPDAVATYAQHSPEVEHLCKDIQEVGFSRFRRKAELVYGGPPCQPFSTGGLRLGTGDGRNMIPAFLEAVRLVKPEALLMENVPGLAVASRIGYLEEVLADVRRLGYRTAWRILNAADYGVPQKRRRLFIVGLRDKVFRFPRPTHGPSGTKPHVATKSIVSHEPHGEPARSPVSYAPKVDLRLSPYAGHVFNGGGRPIDLEGPCHTILASAGGNKTHWVDCLNLVPAYHRHLMEGGAPRSGVVKGARRLTVEESALIQTFPPAMEFVGSKSSRFTQVGDAVPPLLAEVLGRAIARQLEQEADDSLHLPPQEAAATLW